MASYTMELKEYIEMWSQDDEDMSIRDRIEVGRKKLFNFDYPIFSQDYKGVFETNFIRNFYTREIGFETEELFKFKLETWLLINMPYFNKLYESELMKYDPLMNSKMESEWTKTKDTDTNIDSTTNEDKSGTNKQKIDGTNKQKIDGTNSNTGFNRDIESNTPDNRLALTANDGVGVIEYASNIEELSTKNNGSTTNNIDGSTTNNIDGSTTDKTNVTGNTSADITETEKYLQNRAGKIGVQTYSKMMMEYRESLIRIEAKIFTEMQQLFMLVY